MSRTATGFDTKDHIMISMCACVDVEPALVRAPENVAVTQGSDVTLDCSSNVNNSFLTWFNRSCPSYNSSNCIRSGTIYNGYNNRSIPLRFSVAPMNNATHVTRDLSISETQLFDAGVYVCIENVPAFGVQQHLSALLVVLGMTKYAEYAYFLASV